MNHRSLFGCLILGIILLSACKENKDETPPIKPGSFIFSQINTTKSASISSVQNNTLSSNAFDLGNLKKSAQFYFSLSNGGGSPIFDISLRFRKSGFTIYPAVLSSLEIAEKLSIVPSIKVGIIHGLNLDGLGNAKLLDKGLNEDTLSIYGKTLSGKDTIKIHLDAVMRVNAMIADISLFDSSNIINFTNYSFFGSVLFPDSTANSGMDKLRSYNFSNAIKITNTGNVPLGISIFCRSDTITFPQSDFKFYSVLQPGISTNDLNLPLCQNGRFAYICGVKINSGGTISDITKLQYGSDGNIYFALENYCK